MKHGYKAGDVVPVSGVYRFIHDAGPEVPEEIAAIKGEFFPTCQNCRDARFELVEDAFLVGEIEQFQV